MQNSVVQFALNFMEIVLHQFSVLSNSYLVKVLAEKRKIDTKGNNCQKNHAVILMYFRANLCILPVVYCKAYLVHLPKIVLFATLNVVSFLVNIQN